VSSRAGDGRREGLSPLDEDRADSMASEGGRAAQSLEAQAVAEPSLLPLGGRWTWWAALALGVAGVVIAYRGVRRL
jgi:hypothetical protein